MTLCVEENIVAKDDFSVGSRANFKLFHNPVREFICPHIEGQRMTHFDNFLRFLDVVELWNVTLLFVNSNCNQVKEMTAIAS